MQQSELYFGRLPIDRYGKPMNELLVDFINHQNNRSFKVSDLTFLTPIQNDNGTVSTGITFSDTSGLPTEGVAYLEYTREKINDIIPNGQITVHSVANDVEAVRLAIYEQYGLYLDTGSCTLVADPIEEPVNPDVEDPDLPIDDSGGVDNGDGDLIDGDEGIPPTSTSWYTLTYLDTHLLFEGSIRVRVEPSIQLLGTTISRLLDIQSYYTDVEAGKYPTELYMNDFQWMEGPQATWLFKMDPEDIPYAMVAQRLSELTGDPWVTSITPLPFNVYGITVLYNGLVSTEYPGDIQYPYICVFKLSDEFCDNLTGVITVFYRNDQPQKPGLWGKPNSFPV